MCPKWLFLAHFEVLWAMCRSWMYVKEMEKRLQQISEDHFVRKAVGSTEACMLSRSIKISSPVWRDFCQRMTFFKATPSPPPYALDMNITSVKHDDLWSSPKTPASHFNECFLAFYFQFLYLEIVSFQFCPVHTWLLVCLETFTAWTALPLEDSGFSKCGLKAVIQTWSCAWRDASCLLNFM